jgi:hypothetical protein
MYITQKVIRVSDGKLFPPSYLHGIETKQKEKREKKIAKWIDLSKEYIRYLFFTMLLVYSNE